MADKQAHSLDERLAALAAFGPVFRSPGFQFAETVPSRVKDGVITLGWSNFGPEATKLLETVYEFGWVKDFDWGAWVGSPEGQRLLNEPGALSKATVAQLEKVITARFRADRFVEGSLVVDFEHGLLTRIVERAEALQEKASNAVRFK